MKMIFKLSNVKDDYVNACMFKTSFIYLKVCMCVCDRERETETLRETEENSSEGRIVSKILSNT